MSLTKYIKGMVRCQYFRRLVVRAIEDAIILLMMVVGIWLICTVVGGVFRLMGVA